MLIKMIYALNLTILWYFILLSFGYIILLIASIPDIIFTFKQAEIGNVISLLRSHTLPPVTAIIPAYNEEKNVLETVNSILNSAYPNIHAIVINDGSTDQTLENLITTFHLYKVIPIIPQKIKTVSAVKGYYRSKIYKNLVIIDTDHSDKSDCLNVGVNACRSPLFATIDADTLLVEPEAISNIVFSMLTKPHTVAVGGAVYILNGCTFKNGQIIEAKMSYNLVTALQTCEYLRSFLFSRSGWNILGGTLCYAGAFTLFDKQAVLKINGFDVNNIAMDFEIIAHLQATRFEHQYPYRISYTPASIAWTDVPETFKSYWHQRVNWQSGSLQSLMKYKRLLFNPKYQIVGFVTYPFFLFGEILGAIVEFTAYILILASWYMGILDVYGAILFFIICWGFVAFITMATTLMSFITFNKYRRLKDLIWMMLLVVVEQFGFRQFSVLNRVYATLQFFWKRLKLSFPI